MGLEFSNIIHNEDMDDYNRVGFSDSQLKSIKKKFYDRCSNSETMSKADFSKMFGIKGGDAFSDLFDYIDMDKDGFIDDYEFICALALFTRTSIEERIEAVFNLFDADRSQVLQKEEFINLIRVLMNIEKSEFGETGGKVQTSGVQSYVTEDEVQAMFKNLKEEFRLVDGEVTLADFQRMVFEQEEFALALNDLGVLDADEFEAEDYDKDLDDELNKDQIERDDDYENMKKGIVDVDFLQKEGLFEYENVGEGEQFMATKPWVGTVNNSVPSNYKPSPGEGTAPDARLILEYVYGYRCHDTRNNIRYSAQGNVVYHTAAVGIVMNPFKNEQKFVLEHTDDIMCLAIHGSMVATGEIGKKPVLCLWDADTPQPTALGISVGLIENGISHLAFSHDGKMLACISMDSDHSLFIFDVAKLKDPAIDSKGAVILKGKGPREDVLDIEFSKDNSTILAAAKKNFYFVNVSSQGRRGLKITKGTGWGRARKHVGKARSNDKSDGGIHQDKSKLKGAFPTICIGFIGNDPITGSTKGQIFRWKGASLNNIYQHGTKGFIYCIDNRPNDQGVITGSSDGTVFVWKKTMEVDYQIVINSRGFRSLMPKVRSVCEHPDGRVLVGTRGSDILEYSDRGSKMKILNQGHYDFELWGLAEVPDENSVVTCGEDFLLAKWDLAERRRTDWYEMKYQAKALDISPNGEHIAVGCVNGRVLIFNKKLEPMADEIQGRKKEISVVEYSPDNRYLAVGGHDTRIYIYNVNNTSYTLKGKLTGHHSTITHLDWSVDSSVIQSNSRDYELLYWNISNCTQDTRGASNNKDEKWATFSCPIAWATQGIWPPYADGTDINMVDRSDRGHVLATGDDFGNVKLFKFPCNKERSDFQKFGGHSSHVTNVKFCDKAKEEDTVVSLGGNDKAIFQWRYFEEDQGELEYDDEGYDDEEFDSGFGNNGLKQPRNIETQAASMLETDGIFQFEDVGEGDQMGSTKPFLGQIRAPNDFRPKPRNNEAPDEDLKLKYVHGYRCFDSKNSAKWLHDTTTQICFISAALGVRMETGQRPFAQHFFNEHDEDLISFDIHPELNLAATGQMAAKGKALAVDIFVWDCLTMTKVSHLVSRARGSIKHVCFSTDGNKLLSIRQDDDNMLSVWDWRNERLLTSSKVDRAAVVDICWDVYKPHEFVTVGPKHIKFWNINGTTCRSMRGKWKGSIANKLSKGKALALISSVMVNGITYTGSCRGEIIVWQGCSIMDFQKPHNKQVYVLHYSKQRKSLLSGAMGGRIIEWDISGKKLGRKTEIVAMSKFSDFIPAIKSIDTNPKNGDLLIGTKASELYILKNQTGAKPECIMKGHFELKKKRDDRCEVWGLACQPGNGTNYVTSGGDYTVRLWSATKKGQITYHQCEEDVRALDWSVNDNFIVAGGFEGMIYLFNNKLELLDRKPSYFKKHPKKRDYDQWWIEDIKISPNEELIAFGAHGTIGDIQIMKIIGGKLKNKMVIKKFTAASAIIHLDWSKDSSMIVTNSTSYELLFFSADSGDQVRATAVTDLDLWQTWTCVLGFPVQGIFPGVDGTDVNTVCRANCQTLMATGDDFQCVNLFRYPSTEPKSGCKKYIGHSSHVTSVKFMMGDNALISTGGNDKTNMIWTTTFGDEEHPGRQELITGRETGGVDDMDDDDFESELGILDRKRIHDKYAEERDDYGMGDSTTIGGDSMVMSTVDDQNVFSSMGGGMDFGESGFGFQMEEVQAGEEFMAVKPWKGQIREPSDFRKPRNLEQAPNIELKLEYVHGYRCKDMRNNIFYNNSGDLVWNAAAVGVVHNSANNTQTFFNKHSDDVISIAKHPDGHTFATGNISPKPHIYIWDSEDTTKEPIAITSAITKGVSALAFSPQGNYLVSTCLDDDHKVVVFDVSGGGSKLMMAKKGGGNKFIGAQWYNEEEFCTFGPGVMKIWNLATQKAKSGLDSKLSKKQKAVLCGSVEERSEEKSRKVYAGNANGEVMIYGTGLMKQKKITKKFVNSISVGGKNLIVGTKDFFLHVVDKNTLEVSNSVNVYEYAPHSFDGNVRAVAWNEYNKRITIGLKSSEIYEVSYKSLDKNGFNAKSDCKVLNMGHYARCKKWLNEVWGLATLTDDDHYITVSDDATIRLWSSKLRTMITATRLDIDKNGVILPPDSKTGELQDSGKLRSVDVHPNGEMIAVGCKEGSVRIVALQNTSKGTEFKQRLIIDKRKRWIEDLKFSPDGNMLAVGSHDGVIDFYKINKGRLRYFWKMDKHNSFITHLDWSQDSSYIHSNCANYEILYTNVMGRKMDTSGRSSMRDEKWHTWTITIGWHSEGIFRSEWDGTDVNKTDRSNTKYKDPVDDDYHILATADDFSKVRLYRYPCITKNSDYVGGDGHSSHVTNVKWSKNDTYLYSTGGEDQCVFQWRVHRR